MSQTILKESENYADIPDTILSEYFRNAGDMLADESAMLGAVIRSMLASGEPLTNKTIILRLMGLLELTDDVVKVDIIRKTLEIIVDHTTDDI
ncbi:two-component-system connector protein AriR [Pectobacterium carotovorum subsp. carotovorum]|uniref:biofilm development regulator YmgB/AriR family protein n=1 Tax=Pectobacterium actinidiae TaxID=1507808 RepID=UPI001198AB7A|nr:biofilm development regulator YmgB/AriR family protein [Pectobacterium actinidiae]MDY4313685.1 biofilm development regulator YmgB/AriR family protein [Pectobacterium actinidiae]QDX97488.1 two-component-system connector protein AriR [Pectobacterium carotovorum subsp. carotovorum]GKW15015.1 two-component-system connector protein AriR [Pectobacterium carotovorum subsp. carotovorum]GLW37472.1 two-component-system connector protein AriR [Pectobacterium carotovorum subsp. carotovorum]